VQNSFGRNIFKVEDKHQNTQTILGVVAWVCLHFNSDEFWKQASVRKITK